MNITVGLPRLHVNGPTFYAGASLSRWFALLRENDANTIHGGVTLRIKKAKINTQSIFAGGAE